MRRLKIFFVFIGFLATSILEAQTFGSVRIKKMYPQTDSIYLDSLSIQIKSESFEFYHASDSLKKPILNYANHYLVFKNGRPDSLIITYKVFPFNFEKEYFHKDPELIRSDFSSNQPIFSFNYDKKNSSSNVLKNDGLVKNGNISRGVSVGNNQDAVLNSNLNLQISGKLTPEIDLLMAATDNNIPFQADGTTAQLQEFDKVFIQLSNTSTKLIVGDYQIAKPNNSYFMSFFKRAQGLYLSNTYVDSANKKPVTFRTYASGAISRGKFSRQVFFGIENNQGPYRLKGADNEPFIIVLSGTERIYIDGLILKRGQENDYIIDYNTGEVTFTAKQLITKDKRIVAEFQYAERNYSRSLFHAGEEIQWKRASAYVNFYSEQDNKNRSLQQSLSDADKILLSNIGDTLSKAVISGVVETEFNTNDVLYNKRDTVVNSINYNEIYVHSETNDSSTYTVRFSYVGNNNGYYKQKASSANGRVYEWVAPVNGILQGSYEPVIQIVTPKQNQMLTAGVNYSFTPSNTLSIEGVYTKNNINTFSSADKGNDEGSGVKIKSLNSKKLNNDSIGTSMIYNLNYEFVQKNFQQIERFRSAEFDRDWNRNLNGIINNDQHIGQFNLGILRGNKLYGIYDFNTFIEGENYEGIKHQVNTGVKLSNLNAHYKGSLLNTTEKNFRTRFYRHAGLFEQSLGKIKLSYSDVFENNIFIDDSLKELLSNSYQFWEWEGSISSTDTTNVYFKLFYKERRDKQAYNDKIKDSTFATNVGVKATINYFRNHPITLLSTYRELNLKNTVSSILKPDNTLINRVEYNPRMFKGLLALGVFYETGYGLENKREFYYLEVAPGQGQYAWIDYNGDNIKQLNEFEISQFSDQAKYIRLSAPTNDYVKILHNQISGTAYLRPSVLLREKENKLAKTISRFSFQTNYRTDSKNADNGKLYYFNPNLDINDSLVIANTNNFRQSIFFNQSSAVFGGDYSYFNNSTKQLINNGIETRIFENHVLKWRFNFSKWFTIQAEHQKGIKGQQSLLFSNRNYLLHIFETDQKISFQPNTTFRISLNYKYTEKINHYNNSNTKAFSNNFGAECRYTKSEKGNLTMKVDYISIVFNGEESSATAYEMLSGLSKGDNYTWELNYLRNLSSNIQISIGYNGRKTGTSSNLVHIGNGTIRAFF